MADQYRAAAETKSSVSEQIAQLPFPKSSTGQYNRSTAVLFKEMIQNILKEQHTQMDSGDMSKPGLMMLMEKADNKLNQVKTFTKTSAAQEMAKWNKDVAAKKKAAKAGDPVPVECTLGQAQMLAEEANCGYQSCIGAKRGVIAEVIAKVGIDVVNDVVMVADGSRQKSVDDISLHELIEAVIDGTIQ